MPRTRATPGLDALTPDPRNARRHTERNLSTIAASLEEVRAGRSIVIDEDNVILAGNATVEAARRIGITGLRIIETDGEELVAVKRTNLTAEQKARLALFDNRAAELADGWDVAVLQALEEDGVSLEGLFSPEELEELYAGATSGRFNTDPDDLPALPDTDVQPGDLFKLGEHFLLCGSATESADVERLLGSARPQLMATDPPYGVSYDPSWRRRAGVNRNTKKLGKVANDDQADWTPAFELFPGEIAYVYHAALKSAVVEASLQIAGFELRAQIIWAKDRMALGRGDYHWQHEPVWYGVRKGQKGGRTRDRSQTTLWRISGPRRPAEGDEPPNEQSTVWEIPAREDGGHGHGTQKPVECFARPMRNHRIDTVYEPFSGSGTALIAATMQDRTCYAIEIEPRYVALALARWEAFTGQHVEKVAEGGRG